MRPLVSIGICATVIFAVLLFLPNSTFAAGQLSLISDLISDSRPSSTSTLHTLTFTVGTPVPPGGQVTITPEPSGGGSFTVPPAMDYTDMTFSVSTGGGPFVPRTLTILPSATDDGVTVTTGVNGFITFNLASGVPGLGAGDVVQITIGQNNFIISPAVQGSYHVRVRTFDGGGTILDIGSPLMVVVNAVAVDANVALIVPFRFNGLPSGLLPGATTNVLVSLNTDVPATCKYASTSGIDYFAMSSTTIFLNANAQTLHYINVPVFQNDIFTYFIRCISLNQNANPDDFIISFEVGVIPSASSTPLPPPPPPMPSGPSGGGGGGGLYLKGGDVTISGSGIPGAALTILKDGKIAKEDQISVLGSFTEGFTSLERGTYTWGVYVKDPDGNLSSIYNSTIYLIGGTNNIISPVYLSPTIKAATTTVPIGGSILLSGYGIALTPVQAIMNRQGDVLNGKIVTATTTANGNGSWKMVVPTDGLIKGTYEVKVQSLVTAHDQSNFSPTLYIGVGENPNPDFKNRSDLNKDGKVNLVDFSILLFNWKTADAVADINQDGVVNLTDFSIMLSNWTG